MRPSLFFTTSLTLSSHLRHNARVVRALSSSSPLQATTTRQSDGTIVIAPDDLSRHSASVILCHGLGDTAEGWVEPAQYLAKQMPHVKFILPTAPTRPVTMNMGMAMPAWYDIIGLDSRSSEVCNGMDESMDRIVGLLEDEAAAEPPVDPSRAVLAGFSQGGALALYAGLSRRRARGPAGAGLGLAGIAVMSGYLPRASRLAIAPGSEATPVLHCHGGADPVVPVGAAEASRARVASLLEGMGGDGGLYRVVTYPGLDHGVAAEELDDVASFLKRVIPPVPKNDEGDREDGQDDGIVDPAKMSVRQLRDAIRNAGLEDRAKGMFDKSEYVDLLAGHLNAERKK